MEWTCPTCSFNENKPEHLSCQICKRQMEWGCSVCTFLNSPSSCKSCDHWICSSWMCSSCKKMNNLSVPFCICTSQGATDFDKNVAKVIKSSKKCKCGKHSFDEKKVCVEAEKADEIIRKNAEKLKVKYPHEKEINDAILRNLDKKYWLLRDTDGVVIAIYFKNLDDEKGRLFQRELTSAKIDPQRAFANSLVHDTKMGGFASGTK